jgi:hypothetical protein
MPTHLRKYEKRWKDGHAYFILTSRLVQCIDYGLLNLFARITGSSITIDEARVYELSLPTSVAVNAAQVNSSATDENRVLTFTELKELIESGNVDKIPNNKTIPETLNACFFLEFSKGIFSFIHIGCNSKSIDGCYKKKTLGNRENVIIAYY